MVKAKSGKIQTPSSTEDPPLRPSLSEKPQVTALPGLGERGGRLWCALVERVEEEQGRVLLEEACRIADRLDKLDALLQGDADVWCRLVHNLRTEDYELRIDSALIEARQQANVLRQLVLALPLVPKEDPDDGDPDEWITGMSSPVRDATES